MSTLCVSGGRVLLPDHDVVRADVLVDENAGEIRAVGEDLGGDRELDATDSLVIPGLVNAHTHAAMTLLRGYADDKPLDAWLQEDVWPVEAALEPADVRVGTELAAVEMITSGTTAFADMYFHCGEIVDAVADAGLRARVGHGVVTVGKDDDAARADAAESIAVAEAYAGAADGRVQTMFAPHSLTTVDPDVLEAYVARARAIDVPVHFHANETTDEVEPIVEEYDERPLAWARDRGLLEPGDFLAHGVHTTSDEHALLADADTGVVHCPASNMKLASGMAPVQAMRDADVTVALGTDGAASNNDLDVFGEMRDAAMLGKLAADDASAVPADAVVEIATRGGADVLDLDSGRIEPGANADLAVLDLDAAHLTPAHDLVSHLAYAARGSDVRHTICDGQVLMRDRELTTLDADGVRERAQDRADALVARA